LDDLVFTSIGGWSSLKIESLDCLLSGLFSAFDVAPVSGFCFGNNPEVTLLFWVCSSSEEELSLLYDFWESLLSNY
jgi:hypothetical protein